MTGKRALALFVAATVAVDWSAFMLARRAGWDFHRAILAPVIPNTIAIVGCLIAMLVIINRSSR